MNWAESAACVGEDPTYFEYEPGRDETREDMLARAELAQEVCVPCPVKLECKRSAKEADRMWTTRGGLMPVALTRQLRDG